MENFTTPMMRQYERIKKQYPDCLLFYRMGDFYELFLEDAYTGASVLNITLTSRPRGKDGRIPMAGVPYHAVDSYLAKLVKAGFKVAICEQVSLPNKHGIIDREVIRVVTPGTVLDEKALEKKQNNYIISLCLEDNSLGLAVADVSTGYFAAMEKETDSLGQTLKNELAQIDPTECILPESLYSDGDLLKLLKEQNNVNIYRFDLWEESSELLERKLMKHFSSLSLQSFSISGCPLAIKAAGNLLSYLKETQKSEMEHIRKIMPLGRSGSLLMDRSTMINLELFSTIREHELRGSLLSVLDATVTAMGGRLLKSWLVRPLVVKEEVEARLDTVSEFVSRRKLRSETREIMRKIPDIERILSRLSVGLGGARDLVNLKDALKESLKLKHLLRECTSQLLRTLAEKVSGRLEDLVASVEKEIVPDPPISLHEGGIFNVGVDETLDRLRGEISNSKKWIAELEGRERQKTGISSLKVRFNKIFGFYIEVSKANLALVPKDYVRKQTMVNGERFETSELKKHEEIVLASEEKISKLEFELFSKLLAEILRFTEQLQQAASAVGSIDALSSFAELAESYHYTRPKIIYSGEIIIKDGRHPVVEKLLDGRDFVPNDLTLDNASQPMLLLTGPNMAGKSVLIRQTALIVLLAQIGSFVPASSARLSLVDQIFVRSGASDVITSGLSTFMVEMVETAYILNHATKNSLIVMDEVGRGTSTYDGISIAWAIAHFLVTHFKIPPKTLFATHYHELQKLEEEFPGKIKNYQMSVEKKGETPVFLYKLNPGAASHSYGIAVAKLAGMPATVLEEAMKVLSALEKRHPEEKSQPSNMIGFEPRQIVEHLISQELKSLDIATLTPLQALNKLAELKDKLDLIKKEREFLAKS